MREIKVQFYLREPHDKTTDPPSLKTVPVPIMMSFMYATGRRVRRATGESVRPDYWNFSTRRVMANKPGATDINNRLNDLASEVRREVKRLKEDKRLDARVKGQDIKPVNPSEIERAVDIIQNRAKRETLVLEYIKAEIARRANKTKKYKESTIKVYANMLKLLEGFTKPSLSFDEINKKYFDNFNDHLIEKDYSPNYRRKMLSTFKSFLVAAMNEGKHTNVLVNTIRLKNDLGLKKGNSDNIRLTVEELHRISKVDLSASPYLDRQRGVLIAASVMGLRYSDWENVDLSGGIVTVDGFDFLQVIIEKGEKKVFVPLMDLAKNILETQGGKLYVINANKSRAYFRKVGAAAGLDAVHVGMYRGKRRSDPRHKWIGTHTARRTFISLARSEGIRDEYIEIMTGHAPEGSGASMTQYYDKRPPEEKLKDIIPALRRMEEKVRSGGNAILKTIHKAS